MSIKGEKKRDKRLGVGSKVEKSRSREAFCDVHCFCQKRILGTEAPISYELKFLIWREY